MARVIAKMTIEVLKTDAERLEELGLRRSGGKRGNFFDAMKNAARDLAGDKK
jgi:hypothetical protein